MSCQAISHFRSMFTSVLNYMHFKSEETHTAVQTHKCVNNPQIVRLCLFVHQNINGLSGCFMIETISLIAHTNIFFNIPSKIRRIQILFFTRFTLSNLVSSADFSLSMFFMNRGMWQNFLNTVIVSDHSQLKLFCSYE